MTWLQVVFDELTEMSRKFEWGASDYSAVAGKLKVAPPDSGEGALNTLIQATMGVIDVLNRQVVGEIQHNGQLVAAARDSYERHDIDNRELYDDMIKN